MSAAEIAAIMLGWAVGVASPGPAIMALISTALSAGRRAALAFGAGIVTGTGMWGLAAGAGLGALMSQYSWTVEVLRFAGAGYLLYLAVRSGRRALSAGYAEMSDRAESLAPSRAYAKGLMIHLTNPKAIFFWGSLYAVVVSPDAPWSDILTVGLACLVTSATVVTVYALLFSTRHAARIYLRLRRVFDGVFAALFGTAAVGVLTMRFT